jgi:hypothetical protein
MNVRLLKEDPIEELLQFPAETQFILQLRKTSSNPAKFEAAASIYSDTVGEGTRALVYVALANVRETDVTEDSDVVASVKAVGGSEIVSSLITLKTQGADKTCLVWNVDEWSGNQNLCTPVESNATHLVCSCSRLTRFTVGEAFAGNVVADVGKGNHGGGQQLDGAAFAAVVGAAAAAFVVLTILAVVLVVLYCKRVKVSENLQLVFCLATSIVN